jgi:hypothetical protein
MAAGEDVEGRVRRGHGREYVEAGCSENLVQLSGADNGINFGDVLLDLVTVALDEAASDDEFSGCAVGLETRHFKDRVDGFLLCLVDEGAGVDDEDVGGFVVGRDLGASAVEEAHHDFAVDEVLGTAEGDESHARAGLDVFGNWSSRREDFIGHSSILPGRYWRTGFPGTLAAEAF